MQIKHCTISRRLWKLNNKGLLLFATQQDLQTFCETHDLGEILTADEYRFFSRFFLQKRKDSWLLGRYCAKLLFQYYWKQSFGKDLSLHDIQLLAQPFEKPKIHIKDIGAVNVDISISHTNDIAVAVLCLTPNSFVGIDVERVKKIGKATCKYFLSRNELKFLNANSRTKDELVTTVWSLKEATLKALGIGLNGTLKGISVDLTSAVPHVTISKQNVKKSSLGTPSTISASYGMIGKYTVATVFLEH